MDTSTASEDDVRFAYRLLLDREPESEAAVAHRIGQPLDVIFRDIATSDERRDLLDRRLFGAGDAQAAQGPAPSPDLKRWIAERSPLSEGNKDAIRHVATWGALQRAVALDPAGHPPPPSDLPASDWSAPVEADDVASAYRLILGREPESEAPIADRIGRPFAALVAELLSSDEFDGGAVSRRSRAKPPASPRRSLSGSCDGCGRGSASTWG